MISKFIRKLKAKRSPAAWLAVKQRFENHKGITRSTLPLTQEISDRAFITGFGDKSEIKVSDYMHDDIKFLEGKVSPDHERWCIQFAEDTVFRCAPWAKLFLTPNMQARKTNFTQEWKSVGGQASWINGRDAIYATMACHKTFFMDTIHHEIFHIVECHIDSDVIDQIRSLIDPYAEQYDGDEYSRSKMERFARAYAHFACLADEGLPVLVDVDNRDLLGVFSCIYTGELAKQIRIVEPELFDEY